jgi:putative transposase
MGKASRFTRKTLPPQFRNHREWPAVDLEALDPETREHVERRQRALRDYLDGLKLIDIEATTGVRATELLRDLERCTRLDQDNRIFGWRALLPWKHTQGYSRTAPPKSQAGGQGGTMAQFFREHREIEQSLSDFVLERKGRSALLSSRYTHRDSYAHFRRQCAQAGIASTQYPFNSKDLGRRAIRRYCRQLLLSDFAAHARVLGGPTAQLRTRIGQGRGARLRSEMPFDIVCLDAHKLDAIGCVRVPRGSRVEHIPAERLNLILVVDDFSSAILGYHVSLGEPSALDIAKAIRAALTRWKPRALSLPGLEYPEGASMPSAAIPGCEGLAWNALFLDNAMVHRAYAIAETARKRIGCAINFGPVGQWWRRALVESLFSALERRVFLRLCVSTGTGPADPVKPNATANAVKYEFLLEELRDLLDISICVYNAEPKEALEGLTPLQFLSDALLCAPTLWLPRRLPQSSYDLAELCVTTLELPVRGSRKEGRHPYVQYLEARYSSPVLSQFYDLIGTRIRVHLNEDDIGRFKAFLPSGEEIGFLTANDAYSQTKHDSSVRRQVLKARREKKLIVGPGEDHIAAFTEVKTRELLSSQRKRIGKPPRISKQATALARTLELTQLPIPQVSDEGPHPDPPQRPTTSGRRQSSLLPRLRHRGVQK